MIRGVTFDFWNTLLRNHPEAGARQAEQMLALLVAAGIEISREEIDAARAHLRRWSDERWFANRPITPEEGGAVLASHLGLSRRSDLVHHLGAIYRGGADPSTNELAPNIGEVLDALRASDIAVGIICDAAFSPGATLRSYLDHFGLLGSFDHYVFSDEVGAFKPDRVVFDAARVGLRLGPDDAVMHIGDLRRTDVAGAAAAGFQAVRYRGLNDDTDESFPDAPTVIDDHRELLEVLSLG